MSGKFIFTKNGNQIAFDDVFVSAKQFQQGTNWVWGTNVNAQLGVVDSNAKSTPVTTFAGGLFWKEISNGRFGGYGLTGDGQIWAWGNNSYGQLGTNGIPQQASLPTTISVDKTWKSISVGSESHTAAIKTDGTLWMWGLNNYAQLGINVGGPGVNAGRCTPVTTFAGGNNWKQVSCGRLFTAAVKTDGTLWTWGNNYASRLGIGTVTFPGPDIQRSTPVTTFAGGNDWKSVSCGYGHVLAIKNNGSLWAWGVNDRAQCAQNPNTSLFVTIPTEVEPGFVWKTASSGRSHSAGITTNGALWIWGANDDGQLGLGATSNTIYTSPFRVSGADFGNNYGSENWKDVVCGQRHTVALKSDGTLWCWGRNASGQVGVAGTDLVTIPVQIGTDTNWRKISVGPMSLWSMATKYDGTSLFP
jgi:alpha-tubulin suppressor-like RCC1 family protein